MSRSYKNIIKVGIATGNNGPWYKARRRLARRINNHNLRNLIANYHIDEVNDLISTFEFPKHDDWREPTDGSFLISKESKNEYLKNHSHKHDGTIENWWNRKFGKYLKFKH